MTKAVYPLRGSGVLPSMVGDSVENVSGRGACVTAVSQIGRVTHRASSAVSGVVNVNEASCVVQDEFDLPPLFREALRKGVQNRYGVVELRPEHAGSFFTSLSNHLERAENGLGLGDKLHLHALAPYGGDWDRSKFYIWSLSLSVTRPARFGRRERVDTFAVPITEVSHSLFEQVEQSHWPLEVFHEHANAVRELLGNEVSRHGKNSLQPVPSFVQRDLSGASARLLKPQILSDVFLRATSESWEPSEPSESWEPSEPEVPTSLPAVSSRLSAEGRDQPARVIHSACDLNLQGLRPLDQDASSGLAYRQQQEANQCGVSAINGFFQNEVVNTVDAVCQVMDSYMVLVPREQQARLPGLFHPRVVAAMRGGRTVQLNRSEFFGEFEAEMYSHTAGSGGNPSFCLLDEMYALPEAMQRPYSHNQRLLDGARVQAQWQGFFDRGYAEEAAEWWQPQQTLRITPSNWLAVFGGLGVEHVENLVNRLLQTKEADGPRGPWVAYPRRVGSVTVDLQNDPWLFQKLHNEIDHYNVRHLICMVGRGMDSHFVTLIRNRNNYWLMLDGMETSTSGVQQVPIFSPGANFSAAFTAYARHFGLSKIVCCQRVADAVRSYPTIQDHLYL